METIQIRSVHPAVNRCPVHLGQEAWSRLARDLAAASHGRTVLVSDSNVAPLYSDRLRKLAAGSGVPMDLLVFPAGERHKTREAKADLEDRMAALQVGRDGAVVALGGGVTGDLAGFLAATWSRGIPVYQVPTTLLAMVDAAIGGKTGLDLPGAKNRIGAFHTPAGVYIRTACLETLPAERFRSGLAEVIKYGVIADPGLFTLLEDRLQPVLDQDPAAVQELVSACVRAKAAVVEQDPLEAGLRAVLNFGHTVGHALEAASGYALDHGQAVAVGMVAEGRLATTITGFPVQDLNRLQALLEKVGLPVRIPCGITRDRILAAAAADKKSRQGRVRCTLPARIGEMMAGPDPTVRVSPGDLEAVLTAD